MAVCNTLFNPNCNTNPDAFVQTQNYIQIIFSWLLTVAVIYFLFNFIIAGYHFISSGGDAKKLQEAKDSILNNILGLALIFIVFVILRIIGLAFGIQNLYELNIQLPTL